MAIKAPGLRNRLLHQCLIAAGGKRVQACAYLSRRLARIPIRCQRTLTTSFTVTKPRGIAIVTSQRSHLARPAYHTATLAELTDLIWSLLAEGVDNASSPFHTPALAIVGDGQADVRTVVLRHADASSRQIGCHTDWRSPKRSQAAAHNRVTWMVYDRARKLQLRLRGQVTLHHKDALARERWSSSPPARRVCYASPLAPGSIVQRPAETSQDPDGGWDNFTVLTCSVNYMDWLFLCAGGHRRAIFRWHHTRWRGEWVAP